MAAPKTDTTNSVILVRLETKLDALTETVEDVKGRLYGNGRPGIIIDQEGQDNEINKLLEIARKNEESIQKLYLLSAPTWLIKNWKIILVVLTVFFLILHAMIPADASIWTLVGKFFTG
jgi:hypothetical protein